jgi:trehalose 6-phosphate phosphatase
VPHESLNLARTALLLDIDGTLLDLAPTPHEVRVPPTLRSTLEKLREHTGGALALVSGRALSDIDLIFHPLRLPAVGGHGAEIRLSVNGAAVSQHAMPLDDGLKRQLVDFAAPRAGIILEDKGYSLAIHYRLAPEKKRAVEDAVEAICAGAPPGSLEILPGKAVIEIKRQGVTKGTAIRELMRHAPFAGRQPVFVGDDTTDEHAFAVMPEFKGMAISVGRIVPGASKRFETPSDVRRWLDRICRRHTELSPPSVPHDVTTS